MTATHSFSPRAWLLAAAALAALGSAVAQTATNDTRGIKEAEIAPAPLYAAIAGDRPTMLLAPSVEFPTVGTQYLNEFTEYSPNNEFIGYFNSQMCYEYNKSGGYFEISKKASNRKCSGDEEFSGNFLNWATSSAIDIMRMALTGGDRVIDTPDLTVLQRAYIPDGTANVTSVTLDDGTVKTIEREGYWNDEGKWVDPAKVNRGPGCYFKHGSYFPTRELKKTDGGGNYAGAIPKDMIEALDAQDAGRPDDDSDTPAKERLFIASIGNRIHFGVHPMGGINQQCGYGPYSYALGAGGKVNDFHYARKNAFWPSSSHKSCDYNKPCEADDDGQRVWFGDNVAGHQWITGIVKGTFTCGGSIFNNANRHGDTGEAATSFSASKCWLEDDDANLSGNTPFFYARVKVCDSKDEREEGINLCTEYPNGKKKPTGVIQKYADNLRIAAFGYAIDHTAAHGTDDYKGRFGGVLRAPMKYVGPNTYSPTGRQLSSNNPRAEWDAQTGVFATDPEGVYEAGASTAGISLPDTKDMKAEDKVSGVINYFNRFGRNPSQPGAYKQYDPVTELYYEALRYMQGLAPTPQAVQELTDYHKDGFPVYTSWAGRDPFDSGLGYSKDTDYTCLKSSILIVGDIYTHDAVNSSHGKEQLRGTMEGENADASKNEIDLLHWRDVVRAFETGGSKDYKDGQDKERTTETPSGETTFPSGMTGVSEKTRNIWSLIPGMAYWAHTHDIRGENWKDEKDAKKVNSKARPGLRLTSYFFDVNENGWSTSYDYRKGTVNQHGGTEWPKDGNYHWGNQYWIAAKYGGFLTSGSDKDFNTQGNPFYQTECTKGSDGKTTCTQLGTASNRIWSDLVKKQGDNTDGKANPEPRTYYMPSNARGVLQAFDDIFSAQQPLSQRSIGGADSSGGLQGTSYQALFDGTTWGGDVLAERFRGGAGRAWSANDRLVRELASGKERNIIMGERKSDNTTGAFSFTAADTPNDVRTALETGGADADDVIAWLRGDQSKEEKNGGAFRNRDYLIGDIINSGVKYVGPPSGAANLGTGFVEYVTAQARRTSAVYVGANDGMLHAFHAGSKRVETNGGVETVLEEPGTGSELFAYIPSWMKDDLYRLADPKYVHRMYVDATPVIGDANLKSTCSVSNTGNDCDWRTVLVGGTGGGGKGVYALDVTDPTHFTTDNVLWEFTDADDPDMGYVLGQSRIVKLYTGDEEDNSTTPPTTRKVYRWFAMVPAGVNNYVGVDEQTPSGGNGNANIFLLALDKAATAPWVQNSNYWKIELPRIADIEANYPTGLLNLEAFTGLGSVTEYVYAGDLHGQLWALKFKDKPSSGWTAATLANNYVNGSKIAPLFVAKNKDGNPQPITVAPTILEGSGNGVHFVSFGTGKYFEPDDSWRNQKDSFYTVYSNFNTPAAQLLSRGRGTGANPPIIPDRSYLREVKKDTTSSTADTTYFEATAPFYWGWISSGQDETTRSGWFHDFDEDAEREVADASWITQTSRLMFSTLTPGASSETGVCGTGGGTSKIYTFDMISGKGFRRVSTIGMLAQPLVFFDTPEETPADSTGRRLRISPVFSGQFGSEGSKAEKVETIVVPFGRLSWRRIDNFQELRHEGSANN